MSMIDLSHAIRMGMPVYPGTEAPVIESANTLEKDGFVERKLTMYSHTGTHMDAPYHILPDGKRLDQYAMDSFHGKAAVLDVTECRDKTITQKHLQVSGFNWDEIEYLLLYSGWDRYWGEPQYFYGYPVLEDEAAYWLTNHRALKGIGVDTISVDREDSSLLPVHRILMKRDILIVENLRGLQTLINTDFRFICLPLSLTDADGAPARATAYLESE